MVLRVSVTAQRVAAAIIEARGGSPRSQTVLNPFVPVQFPLKLVDRRMLAPTVAHCHFLRDDGQPLDFQPGQFIQIHFQYADGTDAKRSYSLATIHDHALGPGEAVEIAVSFVPGGSATALFEGLEIGDQLQASGPYGKFCLLPGDHNRRYLLIATGTGVTPYRSMLPLLAEAIASRGLEVVLLQGARTPAELLYGDDFRAFADAHPQFRYVPCFSRELPEHPHADVRHGYVQQHLAEFLPTADGDIAYLCGNPDMVDTCAVALREAGLPNAQIRREKYVSASPPKPAA
ncbi:ferredoxin--NADP reductase [Xanthomonas campestris]|uniref:ferredoxin--NADP reductase n=1 Tax=Xanthomonas campestris TaxID=339 RepID=UPI001E3874EA|nr:ferredoxin--NADP reductase [Xanthomonas campestris]MCC8687942.1 ferredoxin--NADP reductase [Xanthomonas campestris]MEA9680771.1 ferredoxin--NADP reductase [Xanthomonas campestris pv. raphani]MEA9700713.1 ferredoxin--NADP reductase [Xanthomonas campestris pv. raphani]MEA9708012.1 ferredoxin--NADP reductase [Xanthomonas campestris pv. raphani]MEA9758629.1 ferredoxin--NADP reductase [Xanthomonas campestris pv. raphani]